MHSERELRIVVPQSENVKVDEAAAVAVEFGVLRGLLDLTAAPSFRKERGAPADLSAATSGKSTSSGGARSNKSKWWIFSVALLALALAAFGTRLNAFSRTSGTRMGSGGPQRTGQKSTPIFLDARGAKSLMLRPAKVFAGPEPQGQFATTTLTVDPCKVQAKLYVSINQTGNTQLVAGTSSKKIYICSIHVVVAAATNIALVEGTGSVCGTGTAGVNGFGGATAATGWNFMANGGIVLGNADAAVGAEATSADNLCLFNSGSGQVSGGISYVVQ